MEDLNEEVTVDVSAVEETAQDSNTKVLATEKVAEDTENAIENVLVQEAVVSNDEGQKVIAAPKKAKAPRKSNTKVSDEGVIGSNAADLFLRNAPKATAKKVKEKPSGQEVAVWSSKNIRWTNVGELSKGYNIVTKEAADKWLTKDGIREATPEEVAAYYGK